MNDRDRDIPVLVWEDWAEALALLSLDLALPLFEVMGLDFDEKQNVQPVLRELVRGHSDTLRTTFPCAGHPGMVEDIHRRILSLRGSEFVNQFETWFEDIFRDPSGAWMSYDSAIVKWSAKFRYKRTDLLDLGSRAESLSALYSDLVRTRTTTIQNEIAIVKTVGLSEWDQFVYDLRHYCNDEETVTLKNDRADDLVLRYPFLRIEGAIERNLFQLFWQQFVTEINDASEELLWRLGEAQSRKDLPRPRSLKRRFVW